MTAIEELISQSGDERLLQARDVSAATADLDWVGVCSEAVEADVRLQGLNEVGCRQAVVELGNLSTSRPNIIRRYYGPSPKPEQLRFGQPAARLGAAYGHGRGLMHASGLEQLAELQLSRYPIGQGAHAMQQAHQRLVMLAGHSLVLRFFGAVERHAGTRGFPFAVRLEVAVESIGGEDAIAQLGPSLEMQLDCAVRPISQEVVTRLEERHAARVQEWHEDTARLLRNLGEKFESDGYASGRTRRNQAAPRVDPAQSAAS